MAHFWSPRTTTFIFDKHELTPTLEECSILVGKSLDSGLVNLLIGVEPALILSEYLNVNRDEVSKILKANRGSCPFSFLNLCFGKASFSYDRAKIFLLMFFGSVIFPHKLNANDPLVLLLNKSIMVKTLLMPF